MTFSRFIPYAPCGELLFLGEKCMSHFVYIDYKPCGEPFYVGKGTNRRIKQKERNRFHTAICTKYPDWYRQVVFEVTEDECNAEEIRLIALYGRRNLGEGTLTNLTNGGEGAVGHLTSEETRVKMSEAAKLRAPISEETRAKLRVAGKNISEETRAKKSAAAKLRAPISEETRSKMSVAKKKCIE